MEIDQGLAASPDLSSIELHRAAPVAPDTQVQQVPEYLIQVPEPPEAFRQGVDERRWDEGHRSSDHRASLTVSAGDWSLGSVSAAQCHVTPGDIIASSA